jgi:acid phosphatase
MNWTAARVIGAAAVVAALAIPVSCGRAPAHPTPSVTPSSRAAAPAPSGPESAVGALPRPDHLVVAVFENKSYDTLAGNPQAPYLNSLMKQAALFTNAHGVAHPSQPNYLALFSGSTQGVTDDHCPVDLKGTPNLGRQLLDAGHTFAGYSEDLPSPGYRGCTSGRYAAKHNPWADFDNVPASANLPYGAFPSDYATLPTVAFVVPNLCNDMHDCGTAAGDIWARSHLAPYLAWAAQHNSQLLVTFDENDGSAGNQILTLFAGSGVKAGIYPESVDHYRVLRTIEAFYGLPPISHAASSVPITDAWN